MEMSKIEIQAKIVHIPWHRALPLLVLGQAFV